MAKLKLITIPDKIIPVRDETGETTKRNAFVQFLELVLAAAPQKTDTETYLAHEIAEKLEIVKTAGKNATCASTLLLEAAEVVFIEEGIKKLRADGRVSGPGWFYLVDPIRSAVDAPKQHDESTKKK